MLSLTPILATLLIAICTRRVLLALSSGVISGCCAVLLINHGHHLGKLLTQSAQILSQASNIQLMLLIMLISGFVKLLESTRATDLFGERLLKLICSERQLLVMTWLSGLLCFFTDSGNSLLLGPMYRTLYDKMGLCREKLAYILDATSSPVCILVPFIGWGVYLSGLIEQALANTSLHQGRGGMTLLISALPFQFYALLTLSTLPLFIYGGLNYSTMGQRQAHREASTVVQAQGHQQDSRPALGLSVILLPLLTLLSTVIGLMVGVRILHGHFNFAQIKLNLLIAYSMASLCLISMLLIQRKMTLGTIVKTFYDGVKGISHVCVILILAWHLSLLCHLLHSDLLIAQWVTHLSLKPMLPASLFVVAALTSLSTGSSWGTFSILLPISITIAGQLGFDLALAIGAVLSGGLFGDHCSPLSDTTILSAMGAGCSTRSHIETQTPYALIVALITLLGYIIVGWVY